MNDAFDHLALAAHSTGQLFEKNSDSIRELQKGRNFSMLVHGYQPLREKSYQSLKEVVDLFLPPEGLSPVEFPELPEEYPAG